MLSWWVLYRFAGPEERRVISELSLPRKGVGGRVTDWSVRIFLPDFDLGGGDFDISSLPEAPAPVDFSIRRLGT